MQRATQTKQVCPRCLRKKLESLYPNLEHQELEDSKFSCVLTVKKYQKICSRETNSPFFHDLPTLTSSASPLLRSCFCDSIFCDAGFWLEKFRRRTQPTQSLCILQFMDTPLRQQKCSCKALIMNLLPVPFTRHKFQCVINLKFLWQPNPISHVAAFFKAPPKTGRFLAGKKVHFNRIFPLDQPSIPNQGN